MEDSENTIDAPVTGDQPSAADSTEPSYVTADQLQSMRKEMSNDIRKLMAGMLKTQQPKAEKKAAPKAKADEPSNQTGQVDVRELMQKERVLSRSIHKSGFSDEQEDLVRQMVEASNPENVQEFVADLASKFGVGKAATQTENETQTKRAANPTPSSDGGLPAMTASANSDDAPIWDWSPDKVQRYIDNKGINAFRQLVEKKMYREGKGKRLSTLKES